MLFDTHTHLQFKIFEKNIDEVIERAFKAGVHKIIACGTNLSSSQDAIKLAEEFHGVYAAVGIHPHHIFEHFHSQVDLREHLGQIELMLQNPLVVAVGEIGVDKHLYHKTKYSKYEITDAFIGTQKDFFARQLKLAIKYHKSLIVHNREAVDETLDVLSQTWDPFLTERTVFHCCEPDPKLLKFAIENRVFIGIDGDLTYEPAKQEFVKHVPLDLLVVETDSPFLTPSPIRAATIINEPANLTLIIEMISALKKETVDNVRKMSYINSLKLFNMDL